MYRRFSARDSCRFRVLLHLEQQFGDISPVLQRSGTVKGLENAAVVDCLRRHIIVRACFAAMVVYLGRAALA